MSRNLKFRTFPFTSNIKTKVIRNILLLSAVNPFVLLICYFKLEKFSGGNKLTLIPDTKNPPVFSVTGRFSNLF